MRATRRANHRPCGPTEASDAQAGAAGLPEMSRYTGLPVDYVVPLKGNVHIIQTAAGYQGLPEKYPLRPGSYVFRPGAQYHSDGAVAVNLALYRGRGHREPRYPATSLSDARLAMRQYRQPAPTGQYFAPDRGTANAARLGRDCW